MRRRILIFLGVLVCLGVVIAASMPYWLGALTRSVGPRFGVTFSDYQRIGYGRAALRNVVYRGAGFEAKAERVEFASPIAWGWERATGDGASVEVGKWVVTLDAPKGTAVKKRTEPNAASGWLALREQLQNAVAQIDPWVTGATIGPGEIKLPTNTLSIAGATWDGHSLALKAFSFQDRVIDARVTLVEGRDELRFTASTEDDEAQLSVTSRGAGITGELTWWGEPAHFDAQFPARGWIPTRAEISATDWDLPADKLKLGEHYAAVRGDARVIWSGERFNLNVTARSTPLAREDAPPPLDVVLRGYGDLQAITIEELHAQLPGADARLSAPLTITRAGEIRNAPANFTTEIDLAQLPWIEATGAVSGRVEVAARTPGNATPPVTFQFDARDVAAQGVSLRSAVTHGRLEWPRLQVVEAILVGENNERLSASGGWDFKAKELHEMSIAGDLRPETFERWLPKNVSFATVHLDAAASGTLAQLHHRGNVRLDALRAATLKPIDITLEWNGTGKAAERIDARIAAGESRLSFTAAVDLASARLTALEFTPGGEAPLRLSGPANVRWKPALQLENFALVSEKSSLDASVAWGESGRVNLAVNELPSTWLADFVTLPGPPWTLSSLAVNSAWNRGPMTFEAVASATSALREQHNVAVHVHLRGGTDGINLVALRALDNGASVIAASGHAPVRITPAGSPALHLDPAGAVELRLTTTENKVFWDELAKLAHVTVEAPRLTANVAGTWREPTGTLQGHVARVAFAPRNGRTLPPIEAIEFALTADRAGVALERLAVSVKDQRVHASGRLPFPEDGWDDLRKDPLAYARRGAQLELDLPATEIAEFKDLLPAVIIPQGTVAAHVSFRDGALDGSLAVRNAATRPVGSLGALHEVNATVQLEGQIARIESISAELGGSPVRISGTVTLPPPGAATAANAEKGVRSLPKFDVTMKADNIPLVRKVGTLVRADVDVALKSPADAAPIVQGTVRLRNSLFLQDVRGLIPSGTKSKSERPPFFAVEVEPFSEWRLDVQVTGEEFMRLRTTMFNGTASADFRLGGTLGDPTLLGEATIDRGKIRLPFATFSVEEGRVSLTPAQPHEPDIFVVATTRRFEYDLRLEVSGDASSPTLTFESTPPLEHGQVLLMVMAGVVPNNAVTVTHQQRATRLGSYLGQSILSSFGDGDDTSRLTITSGEDISEQGRETYDIEYALDKRWSLTAAYDEYDTHTLGVKWQALRRGGTSLAGPGSESFDTGGNGASARGGETTSARERGAGAPHASSETDTAESNRGGEKRKPAKLDVSGLGWFADFEMEASLKRLIGDDHDVLHSHAIEDALFLLLSAVREDGYLRPAVRVHVVNDDGTRREFTVDADLSTPMRRDLAARDVEFRVTRGTHYYVDQFEVTGLYALEPEAARAYFAGNPGLLKRQKAATFNPDRLNRGVASLESALRERGYAEAKVTAAEPRIDHDTGKVSLAISVTEGPRWEVASVDIEGAVPDISSTGTGEILAAYVGAPWSEAIEQDIAAEVRKNHLVEGYADTRVRVSHRTQPIDGDNKSVQVVAHVTPGSPVKIGEIYFRGNVKTRDATLMRRVPFRPGDPLNPLAIQQARRRISRLGVFDDVDVRLEPLEGGERDVVFDVAPGRRMELNLLAGYNTYEQLRAGVEFRRFNVWGRAHQTRGLIVQSMKSTRGEHTYTVPELFGEEVHGTARLFGLQREEVAFLRQEYGAELTVDTPLRFLDANLTAGYTFEVLRNRDNELETRTIDQSQVEVASLQAGLTRDRRDNPLLPRDGYRWFSRLEAASPLLGGKAEYQRLEFGGTYHYPWRTGRWLHFNLGHGLVTTLGRNDELLPVNKRFFPGGDGSIRGYQLGEAAPRGDEGRFVGAKSYVNASVEFEQSLAAKWSAVVFVDALGSARRLAQYPFDEVLVSAGIGLRYQTLIGPIRTEYGHNLNPRDGDPSGTFLLSIGFPF